MPVIEEKRKYFNDYWRRQPRNIVDARSKQRADLVNKLLRQKEGELLDVGCGRGLILDYFAKRGYQVCGTDISSDAILMVQEMGHTAFLHDLETNELDKQYDIILCLEVLQQLYDPLKALNNLKSGLSENGELIVSVPNEFHLISRVRLLLGRSHLGSFDHSHIRLFSPERNRLLFDRAGLKIIRQYHVPIVPPRWKFSDAIFKWPSQVWPSGLAISSIYSLVVK